MGGRPWQLYDEKYLDGKHAYSSKDPHEWLDTQRDYLGGRTPELDRILEWCEKSKGPIDQSMLVSAELFMDQSPGGPSAYEVSRQLWAFLAPLLKENEGADMIFKNVVRHNGLEAWRRISEPVLEDSELTRKDLQPSVLLDELPAALER